MRDDFMDPFLQAAIDEARQGWPRGIPIGSVLVIDGQIVGRDTIVAWQRGSAIFACRDGLPWRTAGG